MEHIRRLSKMILSEIVVILKQVIFLRRMNKMKIVYPILLFIGGLGISTSIYAQTAESVVYREIENSVLNRFVDCTNQDAGTHLYGVGRGESEDFNPANLATTPSMLTFCFGDSLEIIHMGGNLSGDPDVSTDPGFGYAIYTCPPTVAGGTLQDIENDPCILRNTAGDIQIYTQARLDGNVDFFNQGFFQNLPPNTGNPIQMWFAPITFDFLDGATNLAGFEIDVMNQPEPGPCVEANVADAFSVVYLNAIEVQILQDYRCGGEVVITGGLPEFDASERYSVLITNTANPAAMGSKCTGGAPRHNETFNFEVPEGGQYRIIVNDSKGCNPPIDLFVDIVCEPTIISMGPNTNVMSGDEYCVDFTVAEFERVYGLQMRFNFGNNILQFTDFRNIHPSVASVLFPANPNPDEISVNLFDISFNEYNLADGEILFSACFMVTGNEGDCDMIVEGVGPTIQNEINAECPYPYQIIGTEVCIRSTTVDIATCSTSDTDGGSIIFGPTVGTPGFTYTIENNADPGVVIGTGMFANVPDTIEHTGFGPGTYTVTITDANGQIEIGEATIENVDRLMIDNLIPTNPSCIGDTDGTIDLITSGGVGALENNWTGPNNFMAQNATTINGLEVGMYNVTVTDANGCPATGMRNLFVDSIFVTISAEQFTSCPGGSDGRVFAQATGGTAPYDFAWNGAPPVLDLLSHTLVNAPSGQQVLEVTDANGCSIRVDTFFLGSFNVLDVDSTFMDLTCFDQADGSINITPLSGVGPYTYDWNDIGLGDMNRSGLSAGDYRVLVTDSEGCFDSLLFALTAPDSLNVFVDSTLSSSFVCFGDMNGRIVLNAVGGDLTSAPPIVQWTNDVSDNFGAVNLPGGTYDITVTDARGCQDFTTFTIQEAAAITYTIPPLTEPNCPGDSTALTVINASGGAGGPYLFNVNGGPDFLVDSTILRVPAGRYTIEVTDTIGCTDLSTVSVEDPEGLSIFLPEEIIINLGDSSQFLNPDIRPLAMRDSVVSYQWSPIDGLSCPTCALTDIYVTQSGTYTLTITDVKGCTYSESVLVRSRKIRNVFIPNAFTPNGDGNNPLFTPITGQGVLQIQSFRVFNRWGDIVFQETNIPGGVNGELFGWDGTDGNNRELPIGVYVYAAEVLFIDGAEITYKGDVTLLR